jgi:hypothetical protein
MLSMPRIVRPDPFPEFGSPADRTPARSFSETKNCRNIQIGNGLRQIVSVAGRDTTLSIFLYII